MSRAPEDGLTLIEMLVVLAIVAALGSLTMLSFAGLSRTAEAETAARALAHRIDEAVDAALTSGRRFRLVPRARGYAIVETGAEGEDAFAEAALDGSLSLRLDPSGSEAAIGDDAFAGGFVVLVEDARSIWEIHFDGVNARARPAGEG